MWDQCAGVHEIDGIRVKNFFYRMEWKWPGVEDHSTVCLCGHGAHLCRVHFSARAVA
jgi:hypothetical protein